VRPAVIHLVPRLGAATDGVADYARVLARAMENGARLDSLFLSGDPTEAADVVQERVVQERSAAGVARALRELQHRQARAVVLLHYVGYGYAARGCPFWLVRGLQRWKRENSSARLITMFHELYASGPPWRSSFWLSPVQRALARRVLALSDAALTSLELYRRRLAAWMRERNATLLVRPVYSAIGEPAHASAWDTRPPWLAVFGRAGTEARAYQTRREELARAARALKVERILDIGPRTGRVPQELGGIPVQASGWLSSAEISALLSRCRYGFVDYRSDLLPKSTIFAAYCAHSVAPLVAHDRGAGLDGLHPGTHYFLGAAGAGDGASIARHAHTWYRGHDVATQANDFARLLAPREAQ
jgi:hypothetical protein